MAFGMGGTPGLEKGAGHGAGGQMGLAGPFGVGKILEA